MSVEIKLTVFKVPPGYKHQSGTTPDLPVDQHRTQIVVDTIRRRNEEAWALIEYEIKRALHIIPLKSPSPIKPEMVFRGFNRLSKGLKVHDRRRAAA